MQLVKDADNTEFLKKLLDATYSDLPALRKSKDVDQIMKR